MYYYPVSAVLTECLILSVVEQQDSYGYEISQTVKLVAAIKESTLYPILRKLETGGYLTTYSEEFQGRKRKYYSITEEGRRQLAYLRKEWREARFLDSSLYFPSEAYLFQFPVQIIRPIYFHGMKVLRNRPSGHNIRQVQLRLPVR